MHPFDYERAGDGAAAVATLLRDPDAQLIAGGTDLMQLLKSGVSAPRRLVDINALPFAAIEVRADGAHLGALARMSAVGDHPAIIEGFPAISQAIRLSASPQVRNMASLGGNLLQRTRCAYFRNATFPICNKRRPATGCSASGGESRMQAIFGGSRACIAAHASDLAVALVALDATVSLLGPDGERKMPLDDFYALPGETPQVENALRPGEILTAVHVPAGACARRSSYLKVRDRASFEFALVSVAVGLEIRRSRIVSARLAAGGVGTKPWRMGAVEAALVGARADDPGAATAAAARAGEGAATLPGNAFKVPLLQRAIVRALAAIAGG